MTCTRCRQFDAAPGGELCRACEAEDQHPDVGAGLPKAPPPVVGVPLGPPPLLQSPVVLGRVVTILLGAVVVADLVAVWADLALLDVMNRMVADDWSVALERDSDWADVLIALAATLQTFTYLATAVVFLVWFHRVRVNAEVFDPFGHRKKRGWAIAGWFVPVVNLWFPRRIAVDCWEASGPWRKPRSHALVNTWWTLWLLSLIAGEVGDRAYFRAEAVEEYRTAAQQMLFADSLEIVSAVFAALFVLALTRMQDDKARSGPREPEPVAAL
ncbi:MULTISPECIES: DUF4328 domain-containing protein [unclassified Streptomyces]|uniref:DUF4328 domain-containing protein n=1 Tax=unclassified Streptomyces TaxID=2593676 RepID=UPI002E79C21C|nr:MULTISPECIES: DUF4328 domain-containing protein [unclassified Streptomyces]MEE1758999.1 DUF4328 domain-containing protein [Streptomyces sp. SP18BB07]MEE1833920.1 DUF4328 domain-containing protein [Streptomyces sp. SP17KL33]